MQTVILFSRGNKSSHSRGMDKADYLYCFIIMCVKETEFLFGLDADCNYKCTAVRYNVSVLLIF
jgi:hypothetical protein